MLQCSGRRFKNVDKFKASWVQNVKGVIIYMRLALASNTYNKRFGGIRLDTTKTELTDFRDKYLALSAGAYTKALVADYYML